jgi:hypothetical protein
MNEELSTEEATEELNQTMMLLLRKNIINQLLKLDGSFLTGSNHWYCDFSSINNHSDYDICVAEMNRSEVEKILEPSNLKTRPASYNNGLYVSVGNDKINIIFLAQRDLKPWKIATDVMEFFVKEFDCIKIKKKVRVGVFQTLIALVKMLEAVT